MTAGLFAWWSGIGVLLGIGFLLPWVWWCGVVGIALLIYRMFAASSVKHLLLGITLAWWLKYSLLLLWFWSTYPIEWLPLQSGGWQLVLVFFYWSTAALWLSFGAGVLVGGWWFARRVFPICQPRTLLVLFPGLWLGAEVAGSMVFSLATLGAGGSINSKFSFGYSGYLLAEHAVLLVLAEWGGVYLLSIVISGLGVLLYLLWSHTKRRWWSVGGFLLVLVGTSLVPLPATEYTDGHRVAVVDTAFATRTLTTDTFARTDAITAAVTAALTTAPEYIILPEDTRYFTSTQGGQPSSYIAELLQSGENTPILIDSGQVWRGSASVLQASIYDPAAETTETVDKRYLVPQGEYTPWLYKKALQLVGQGAIVSYIEAGRSYEVGNRTSQRALSDSAPGVLFCFESVDPRGVRTIKAERPNLPFVAHVVSHAWFHEPTQLWRQLDTMLQVQAIWNDTYIVSAGNQMTGAVYTPTGEIQKQKPVASGDDWQVRVVTIPFAE